MSVGLTVCILGGIAWGGYKACAWIFSGSKATRGVMITESVGFEYDDGLERLPSIEALYPSRKRVYSIYGETYPALKVGHRVGYRIEWLRRERLVRKYQWTAGRVKAVDGEFVDVKWSREPEVRRVHASILYRREPYPGDPA